MRSTGNIVVATPETIAKFDLMFHQSTHRFDA
jgi:hypothetical protein